MAETPAVKDERKEMIDRARELPEPPGGFNLRPRNFDEAYRFANFISKSSLIPAAFRGKPEDVMIAVQLAMELGVSPMQGLQNIAVINGRPAIWGDLLPAIVLQSGLLEAMNEEDDGNEARCTVKRKGFAPIVRTFSMEDAETAGLKGKQGPWQQYPKRMRQMRARAFALRDQFADLLKGVGVREEIEDISTTATDVTPPWDRLSPPQRRSEQKEDVDAQPEPSQEEPKQEAKEEAKGQEEGPVDTSEVIALREIAGYTKETFPPPNALNHYMKGQPGKVQSAITAEYNKRKKELGL